ncbi:MAG: hypothetical protein QG652_1132 [Pseudomonadota bacterium]|nr:hypothetical protein [Pseudomonadota bacterium]
MFSFWREYPELADVILPQKIMRPFWHPKANTLDNHVFSTDLPYERPLLICSGILASALLCLALAAFVIWRHLHASEPKTGLDNELIITILLSGLALGAGGYFIHLFIRAVPVRHWQLDRQTHRITVPLPTLVPDYFSDQYDQFQAKILHEINILGRRRARLVIEHRQSGRQICIFVGSDANSRLVGYWSFIVQYMKPDAPLPDVPALNHFPNTTPGVRQQVSNHYSL